MRSQGPLTGRQAGALLLLQGRCLCPQKQDVCVAAWRWQRTQEQQELLFPENVLIPDQEPPQLSLWSPGIPHSTQLAQAQVSLQICP